MSDHCEPCPTCNGRGVIETGEMETGPGGVGFSSVPCADCHGDGSITSDDHDRFKYQFGANVKISDDLRIVFFDYEGDDIFVWWLPGDESTDGPHLTEAQRRHVYQELDAWYEEWCSYDPEHP